MEGACLKIENKFNKKGENKQTAKEWKICREMAREGEGKWSGRSDNFCSDLKTIRLATPIIGVQFIAQCRSRAPTHCSKKRKSFKKKRSKERESESQEKKHWWNILLWRRWGQEVSFCLFEFPILLLFFSFFVMFWYLCMKLSLSH